MGPTCREAHPIRGKICLTETAKPSSDLHESRVSHTDGCVPIGESGIPDLY
jgi:hypothetical protein